MHGMTRRFFFFLLAFAATGCFARSHTTTVNGHPLYYETRGAGRPLLLLHGGGNTVDGSFSHQLPRFALSHAIVAPEQVGHGHTPATTAPLSYAAMASDTAALLDELHLKNVDVVGWSDGGIVALILGIRRPDLVRRLIVSGANFSPEGLPDLAEMREKEARTTGAARLSLDAKLNHLWLTSPTPAELSPELLHGLHRSVLVMAGDHDEILMDHTIALYRALPDARLCILPKTGHNTFGERPEWVNPIILSFLDEP